MIETRELPAPAEPTTPIKPSEALRLGRLIRPRKVTGICFEGSDGACANGAIALGLGYDGPINTDRDSFADRDVYVFLALRGVPTGAIIGKNDLRGDDPTDARVLAYLEERGL